MSKLSRKDQIKIVNSFVSTHDLKCECDKPALHCAEILIKQLKDELTTDEKDHLKSCLGTATDHTEDNGGVTGEDLEKLFAEDGGDDEG